MKTTKRISTLAFAIVAFAVTMTTVLSCQSKQDKNASSEQSNDSAFVFTTPKVLKMEDAIDRHFKIGTPRISPNAYTIPLDILDTAGFLSLSDVADDVEYVLLKTSNAKQEVFIGSANHVFICKDYIFVHMVNNIIQYDRQGNLIRTIGRRGGGPGEYDWVFNMAVDDKTKKVIINCSGKINEYDFDGKFIRSQKNTYTDQLMPIDSNRIAVEVENLWHDVKECLVILNRKGEVEKSFPRYQLFEHTDYGQSSRGEGPRLTKFHDIICFCEAYNDTIFELKNDELQMRYYLDWGKYAMKPDDVYKNDKMISKAAYSYYETDRFLIISAKIGFSFTVVYDKKDNQIRLGYPSRYSHSEEFRKLFRREKLAGFYNDLDGGMVQNINGISLDCQYIISYYQAADVKDYFEEVGYDAHPMYPDKQAKLKALVDTIDENKHNLFIMISKLKE